MLKKKYETESEESCVSDEYDEEKLALVPEYKYTIENSIDFDCDYCIICDKKYTSIYGLRFCMKCFKTISINKTTAKRVYKLTENEITELIWFEYKLNGGILFLLSDVKKLAIYKKFGIADPDIDEYIKYINIILEENDNIDHIKELKRKERERIKEERKVIIDKELKKNNIELTEFGQRKYYDKYINNPKVSLKNTIIRMQEIQEEAFNKKERENKLEKEMKKHDYDIHKSKDPYIDDYIIDNEISFNKCVRLLLKYRHVFNQ